MFRSPDYPEFSDGDLLCSFTFELEDNVAGIAITFNDAQMDGMKPGPPNNQCDQDVMFLRGFGDWVPPGICGNLNGYRRKA